MAKSKDLIIQRHALSLLTKFLTHVACPDRYRVKVADLICELPTTSIPTDRQLRFMVCEALLLPFVRRANDSKNSVYPQTDLLKMYENLLFCLRASNTLKDKFLRLVSPQARQEQEFEPPVQFENDVRGLPLLKNDEIERLSTLNSAYLGRPLHKALHYLLAMYADAVAFDLALAQMIMSHHA